MLAQKICGIISIFFGLGFIFFAKRIFTFSAQRPSAKGFLDRWPAWMLPTYIWGMRIVGIIALLGGLALIFQS